MALNSAALSAIAATSSVADVLTHASLHSAEPDSTGSNEVGEPQAITWGAPSNGMITASPIDYTGLTANSPVTHVGFRDGAEGTWLGWQAIETGDTEANAAGEYTLTSIVATVSAG
jgi:hypothetical protein